MPDLIPETKAALAKLGIFPRKKLGQNFMVNSRELEWIARELSFAAGDTVVEIGPGLGFLTRFLLDRGAEVVAIEKDAEMARRLPAVFRGATLKVLKEDILKVDLSRTLKIKGKVTVVGNIPYSITSPILEWLISQKACVSEAIFTVQKEVAERLTARPGNRSWGPLSAFLQFHARVVFLKKIGKAAFFPCPKVDSAVVRIEFLASPSAAVADGRFFFKVLRTAFQKRRKTLLNSLAGVPAPRSSEDLTKPALTAAFAKLGLDPRRRPETLTLQEWAALANFLVEAPRSVL
ncbi:MAG: ribosomal RNA small subunit methyltransferase A [Candidatus Omnitrophica bacterium]|nr:ribosomal RNA small subunit methyltransferase A [Candidatus Omnitrophota bacterium]